eukprot:TRINITY_DN809_c0_g1_i1.p1 TRINITY_DN809_c0_g1~~TRINITY_DN809_c0_g1_i1.p1  ORF type:complete len:523 (-),score=132.89 TRINITY_DN809_c0_g1_i1:412-1980(-)
MLWLWADACTRCVDSVDLSLIWLCIVLINELFSLGQCHLRRPLVGGLRASVARFPGTMALLGSSAAFVAPAAPAAGLPTAVGGFEAQQALRGTQRQASYEAGSGFGATQSLGLLGVAAAAGAAVNRSRKQKGARRPPSAVPCQSKGLSQDDFSDVCDQTGVTIARYLFELQKRGDIDMDLLSVFVSIREAAKVISKLVNTAPLKAVDLLGLQGEVNVQGEDQKKLDVITNDVMKRALRYTGRLGTLASEEEDAPVDVLSEAFSETGKYVCVFDPLDGSSNVDAGIAVGTIFGIFAEQDMEECEIGDFNNMTEEQTRCMAATLQPGKALVAAGYVLYSSSTELVFTYGKGVVGFTLDLSIGEFIMTRPQITIPSRGNIYSMNMANMSSWDAPMQEYIEDMSKGKGETGKKYSLRYIGSMVGDIHRTLLYGGLFAYPADTKNVDGKLRLLYEAAPMSFILEQAGGKAVTGYSRVMDIPPMKVHQRVPVILGSMEDVEECQKYYEKSTDAELRARCQRRLDGVVA